MISFPPSAAFGKRIPLVQLRKQGLRGCLAQMIKSLVWSYKLAPSTINLAATDAVSEIEVLDICLRGDGDKQRNVALIVEQLSKLIPNPCICRLFYDDGSEVGIAICPKTSGGALYGDSPVYRMCFGSAEFGVRSAEKLAMSNEQLAVIPHMAEGGRAGVPSPAAEMEHGNSVSELASCELASSYQSPENGRACRPATAAGMENGEWGAADSAACGCISSNALPSENTACGQEPRFGRRIGGTPLPFHAVDNCTLHIAHCTLNLPSGVTTLESLLISISARIADMGVIAGERMKDFILRHYKLESLRSSLRDIEKKISKETQLDIKYQLSKDKQKIENEVLKCRSL